jgi:enamine deaminase RidA (YjgF/YER057c/UK114 family)
MPPDVIQPGSWSPPVGYSNGILTSAGTRLCFVAGQIAWDERKNLIGAGDFVAQFRQALSNVITVIVAAGGEPSDLAQMTIFVLDLSEYRRHSADLGAVWRAVVGRHYPAIALVEVAGLLEEGARVEIQAVAALPATSQAAGRGA